MSAPLASPPNTCCITPFPTPTPQVNQPKGTLTTLNNIPTYISTPAPETANGHVLLYFPDAFGLYSNSFCMMDHFAAAAGFLVLGVDYFLGDGIGNHTSTPLSDPNFDFGVWTARHLRSSEEVAQRWVEAVVSKYGESNQEDKVKFACVGYCWGARFVCKQLSKLGICSVGAIAHPSFLNESDVAAVNAPISIVAPNNDDLFKSEQRNRTVELLTTAEQRFSMQVYSNVHHGFATRANLQDPFAKWAKEECFRSFVSWFGVWLGKRSEGSALIEEL